MQKTPGDRRTWVFGAAGTWEHDAAEALVKQESSEAATRDPGAAEALVKQEIVNSLEESDNDEVEDDVVCTRKARKDLRVDKFATAAIGTANAASSSRLALFAVGINEYTHAAPLRNCVSDVSAFAQRMKDEGLVEEASLLTDKSDTTLERLDQRLDEFINQVTCNQPRVIVIFFACHGMQYRGQLYIVPSDANCGQEKLIKRQCMELQDVLKELQKQELQNVPKIVILDVCRNSPFIGVGWRITAQSLEQVRLPVNCKLVFSSTAGEIAEDGRGQHSPFAQSLLENFFERDPTVSQAVDNVCVLAMTRCGQQPTSYGTLPSFHLFASKEPMIFDHRVECPEFSPSGGVFFGETVVKIQSNTSGSMVAVRVRGTEAFQTGIIEAEPIPDSVLPDMASILENYAYCDLDDRLRFKRILFARYPFVAGANIYTFKPHILVTPSKGSNQISDSSLRYTVFVDEGSGMPSLRYSTLEERFLVRKYLEGGHADVLELRGSNRVEVSGFYQVMPTRVGGKPAYRRSGGCLQACRPVGRNFKGRDNGHQGGTRGHGSADPAGVKQEQMQQGQQGGEEMVVAGDAEQDVGVQYTGGADEMKHMYLTFHSDSACWHVSRKEGHQYVACVKLTPDERDRSMGPSATTADQERGTWFELSEDDEWQENLSIEVIDRTSFAASSIHTKERTSGDLQTGAECVEFRLDQCGIYQLESVASKSGLVDSPSVTSEKFTILTWESVSSGFSFDVLHFLKVRQSATLLEIEEAVENRQIVNLPKDSLCTVAQAVQVMCTASAFFGYVIAVPYPSCVWSTPSKEAKGPLLSSISGLVEIEDQETGTAKYFLTDSGARHLQFGQSFLGLISGGSYIYGMPNAAYWDMGLMMALWCFRILVFFTMIAISFADMFGPLSYHREGCIIVASTTGNVLLALSIAEWVIAIIRKHSLGDNYWWKNGMKNQGLVWECAALGFPINCGTYRRTPSVAQLGVQLTSRRRRLHIVYIAALSLYVVSIACLAYLPFSVQQAHVNAHCSALFVCPAVVAVELACILTFG